MSITVYHAGTDVVEHPLCDYGRADVDFGRGFYVTDIRQQADNWARAMGDRRKKSPVVNLYEFDVEGYMEEGRCLSFPEHNANWLDFVVRNRRMQPMEEPYDLIQGGVADDRVVQTVSFYMQGLYDAETALRYLAYYKPNNQFCLTNQRLTDKYLRYVDSERI